MSRRFDNRVSKKVSGFDPISFRTHDSGSYVVSSDVEFDTITAKSESDTFEFYHAKSREQRYQGLSGRKSLAADGMLFEYPSVKKHQLVFRDMHFPLDVLFLDEDGNIVDRGELDEDNQRTESVCLYALEVEKGWIQQNDISLTDSFDISRSLNKEWRPYVGPQEGFGWQNVDTGDIVYQDEPPGPIDLSALSSEQIEQLEESLGEDLTPTDELPNTAIEVDEMDIGTGDFAYIGEEEGFLKLVDRVGDDVHVTFEDGRSFWVGDKEVHIDEDPESKLRDREARRKAERVEESVNIEDAYGEFVEKRQIKDAFVDIIDSAKQDVVADNLLESLETVERNELAGSYYNGNNDKVNLMTSATDSTLHHELGHAIMGSNGSKAREKGTFFAKAFVHSKGDGIDFNPNEIFGMEVTAAMSELTSISSVDMDNFPDYAGKYEGEITRDNMKVDIPENTSDEMKRLVEEVNNAWEKQIDNWGEAHIGNEYSGTSAHETMARLHEHLQSPGIKYNVMDEIIEEFPELLDAYLDVLEPNDIQIEYLEEEGVL